MLKVVLTVSLLFLPEHVNHNLPHTMHEACMIMPNPNHLRPFNLRLTFSNWNNKPTLQPASSTLKTGTGT